MLLRMYADLACSQIVVAAIHRVVRLKKAGQQKGRHLPALLNKSLGFSYGVGSRTETPKMSLLPNVDGQSLCGAGLATNVPSVWRN